jgi:hypothetical protein
MLLLKCKPAKLTVILPPPLLTASDRLYAVFQSREGHGEGEALIEGVMQGMVGRTSTPPPLLATASDRLKAKLELAKEVENAKEPPPPPQPPQSS